MLNYTGESFANERESATKLPSASCAQMETHVSPNKDAKFRLYEGDQVIVLAEDWWTYKSLKVKRR